MTGDVRLGQIRYWLYTACVQLYLLAARAVRSPAKFCRAARGTREEGVHLARRGGYTWGGTLAVAAEGGTPNPPGDLTAQIWYVLEPTAQIIAVRCKR